MYAFAPREIWSERLYLIDGEKTDTRQSNVKITEIQTGEEIQNRTIISFTEGALVEAKVVVQGFEALQEGSLVSIAN